MDGRRKAASSRPSTSNQAPGSPPSENVDLHVTKNTKQDNSPSRGNANHRLYNTWYQKNLASTPVLDTITPKNEQTIKPSFYPSGNVVPPGRKPQKLKPIRTLGSK